VTTGASVQLTAKVTNDSPTVTWGASAGTITGEGKFTAPESVPAGGKVTITATTSKGAKAEKTIEITAPAGTKGLLVGDATATYTVSDQTTAGREEAFQFTAASTGTVEELLFRTNATANTGVTGVVLALFAENAGKPGEVLGSGTASGTPAVSSWVTVTGLSVPVTSGTKYWLVALPLGSGKLHYNAAKTSGGTGNVETTATGLTKATSETSWESYGQGPVGFQANGATGAKGAAVAARAATAAPAVKPAGRIALAGPQTVTSGTAAQIDALAAGTGGPVTFTSSAGEISSDGLFIAPHVDRPTAVTIGVAAKSARGQSLDVIVDPVSSSASAPAPAAASVSATGTGSSGLALGQLSAIIINRELVITTAAGRAGIATITARAGHRLLGTCSNTALAGTGVTCRLSLRGASRKADLHVSAVLRSGHRVLGSRRVSGVAVPTMQMLAKLPGIKGGVSAAFAYICSPSLRLGGPGAIASLP
jgi:hypothetical protein